MSDPGELTSLNSDMPLVPQEGPYPRRRKRKAYARITDREEARRRLIADNETLYRRCLDRAKDKGRQESRFITNAGRHLHEIAWLNGLSSNQGLTEQEMGLLMERLFETVSRFVPEARHEELREELKHVQWAVLHHDDDDDFDDRELKSKSG